MVEMQENQLPEVLSVETEPKPREDCKYCHQTGRVKCNSCDGKGSYPCSRCGGDGKSEGGLAECPCTYNDELQKSLLCEACKGAKTQKCICVPELRIVWSDFKQILGHREVIHVMAEKNVKELWSFFVRETEETKWQPIATTDQALARITQILTILAERTKASREEIHNLVDYIPDDSLNKVKEILSKFSNR